MTWKHDELLSDLAGYLRGPDRMVWTDMQLGPSGSPRPDVYTLQKSYSKPRPTAFEVKVSRSDLRSDTTSGKWQTYLKYAGSVTFAVPDGICTAADIPAACGLIVRKAEVWRYVRKPTVQPVVLPMDAFMKLLIDGVNRVSASPLPIPRQISTWKEHEAVRRKFGDAVELAARNLVAAEKRTADIKQATDYEYDRMRKDVESTKAILLDQAKKSIAEYERIKREICEWLGIEGELSVFGVRRRIEMLRSACDADERVRLVEGKLLSAQRAIKQASDALESAAKRNLFEEAAA